MYLNATILGQTIAFIFFVFFCMKYIWPPIIKIIENRQKKIEEGIFFSEKAKKDLEKSKILSLQIIEKAQKKAQKIIKNANEKEIKILKIAEKKAKKISDKIIEQAYLEINTKKKCVYENLKNHIIELSINGAEKIIDHSITQPIQDSIIKKIISGL